MEITEIKQRLEIGTVLAHYGLTPDSSNRLRCPWHEDKTPSLQIYPRTNSWTCFSSNCQAGSGDQVEFCARMEGDKHRGILVAASLAGVEASGKPAAPAGASGEEEKALLPRLAVLSKVAQESRASYKKVSKVREYVRSRGLDPEQLDGGYIGPELGKSWNVPLKESALKLGILRRSRNHTIVPAFRYCLVLFLKNKQGQVTGLYGRAVQESATLKHLYLSGSHQGLYPAYPKEDTKRLILTESILDAATLQTQEMVMREYAALALYGTGGFTAEHGQVIGSLPALEEVVLWFDGDAAGRAATEKIAAKLEGLRPGLRVTAVPTPEGEDLNSLGQGHDGGVFAHLLQQRKSILLSTEKKNQDPSAPEREPASSAEMGTLDAADPEKLLYHSAHLKAVVWGGVASDSLHRLKVNLHLQKKGDAWKYYQDDVNLYSNPQLQRYVRGASEELEMSSTLIKQSIYHLKAQLEHYRLQKREREQQALAPGDYPMRAEEERRALALLKDKQLVKRTMELIGGSGLIGEQKNGLLLFFLYLTRLFKEPLHAIIFGRSGSGKTYLQTRISECLPEESVRTITSLSENVLYYSPPGFWQHVVLIIEDLDGVYQALLALRELMSKQSITKYTTDKDAKGNNVQRTLTVEGPVSVSGATTREAVYEDNANRSFLLHVDESPAHLEAVMDYQRRRRAGLIDTVSQEQSRLLLQNAQRLLEGSITVRNPYALELTLPQALFKPLRTNEHYLKLIDVIAFYHQRQREIKTDPRSGERYVEATLKDVEWATFLVKENLLRKSDELSGEVRSFFEYLKRHVSGQQDARERSFYSKDVRRALRMHPMKLSRYLAQLEGRGYVKRTGGSRHTGYEYQLTCWEDYEALKAGMAVMDETVEKLKKREKK